MGTVWVTQKIPWGNRNGKDQYIIHGGNHMETQIESSCVGNFDSSAEFFTHSRGLWLLTLSSSNTAYGSYSVKSFSNWEILYAPMKNKAQRTAKTERLKITGTSQH